MAAQFLLRGFGTGRIASDDDDPRTALDKRPCRGETEAGGAADDDERFVL
jgi:hypothetical protein